MGNSPAKRKQGVRSAVRYKRLPVGVLSTLCGVFFLGIGYAAVTFSDHEELASLADDSASYLIMAQYFAQFPDIDEVIGRAYQETFYPPGFPLLLAVAGAANDVQRAHAVVALCFAFSCIGLYFLARQRLPGRLLPLALVCAFAAMPAVWLNLLGVLSENLYLLVSLTTIACYERWFRDVERGAVACGVLGLLLLVCVLTRTVGVSLVMAYVVLLLLRISGTGRFAVRAAIPVLVVALGLGIWECVKPTAGDSYLVNLGDVYGIVAREERQEPLGFLAKNASAVYSAWMNSLLLYWRDGLEPRVLVVGVLGLLALLGTVYRAVQMKFDGWYLLGYLAIIIVWPFRGEMSRFLYPILPLLLLNAVDFVTAWIGKTRMGARAGFATGTVIAVFLSTSAPALTFIYGRATYHDNGVPFAYRHIAEFYRLPDLGYAKSVAAEFGQLLEDLRSVGTLTPGGTTVLWVKPSFMSLLAHRHSARTPRVAPGAAFLEAVRDTGADYVLVSRAIANGNNDGLAAIRHFEPFCNAVRIRTTAAGDPPVSLLLAIDKARLVDEIQARKARADSPAID